MDRPLFSIIMATHNRSTLLRRAIRSILRQTYKNFELVIVDDGSTDDTEEAVRIFGDSRIVYYKQSNEGVLAARNRGFFLAKGKYIALLDDDDELVLTALDTAVDYFEESVPPDVKILWFAGLNYIGGRIAGPSGWGLTNSGYINYRDLLYGKISGNYWQVLRSDVVGGIRFDERLYCGEVILWLHLHKYNLAYYVPIVLRINHQEGPHVSSYRSMLNHLPGLILTSKSWLSMYDQKNRYYYKRLAILRLYQVLEATKFIWKR